MKSNRHYDLSKTNPKHIHISAADARRYNSLAPDDLSCEDTAFLATFYRKSETCSICRARHEFAQETDRLLYAIHSGLQPETLESSLDSAF